MDLLRSLFTWIFNILFIILMFPFTLLAWLLTAPFGRAALTIHRWLSFQGRVMIRISPLWKVNVTGRSNYDRSKNYIIISNHQSLLDIPLVKCLRMDYKWVSKIENFKVPILGQSMQLAGYVSIKRGDKESVIRMMEQSKKILDKGESLFIFPEGTRSPDNSIRRFKTGAFRLALETNTAILPVLINGTSDVLPRKGLVFDSGHRLRMKILEPITPAQFESNDPDKLAAAMQSFMADRLEEMRIAKT